MNFNPFNRIVRFSFLLAVTGLSLSSCQKEMEQISKNSSSTSANTSTGFTEYLIRSGQQYSDQSGIKAVKLTSMKFTVKFDNSAMYTTQDPSNQADINKLYGFSDNNAQHHEFSARFGWRWLNNKLNLQAYTYNNSVRSYKDIADIELNKEYLCEIRVAGNQYQFYLNNVLKVTMPRSSAGTEASGYQLYPYFGGDELAPHDIKIWIREEK